MRRAAATSSYTVELRRPRPAPVAAPVGRVPRVARLLALAHRIDGMVRSGEIGDLATAARLCGLTRARMTQVMNLTLLAPSIQEEILDLPLTRSGRNPITERNVRALCSEPDWTKQRVAWARLLQEIRR